MIDSSFDRRMANSFSIVTEKDTLLPVDVFRNYDAPANEWEYRLNFKKGDFILFLFNDKAFTDSLIKFKLNPQAIKQINEFVK